MRGLATIGPMNPRPTDRLRTDVAVPKDRDNTQRQRDLCLNCVLPDCKPHSRQCPLTEAIPGNRWTSTERERVRLADRFGARIIRHLRASGGDTCPGIAAELGEREGLIYTAIAGLILEQAQPITPAGLRDGCALYHLEASEQ